MSCTLAYVLANGGKTSRYCNLLDGALRALQFGIKFEVSATALSASKLSNVSTKQHMSNQMTDLDSQQSKMSFLFRVIFFLPYPVPQSVTFRKL